MRESGEADLASVLELIQRTIDGCYAGIYPHRAVEFFKQFHSQEAIRRRQRNGKVLVAEQDGKLVAIGTVVGCEISGVFVDAESQGRGLGAALMLELENEARANGCSEAGLDVSLPSRRFYETIGYVILGERSYDVGEGQRLDYWKATKRLSPPWPPRDK